MNDPQADPQTGHWTIPNDDSEHPPSTAPAVRISVQGVHDPAVAHAIGEAVGIIAQEFGRLAPLQDLDGITIATDYPAALAELDRGFTANLPLTPTEDIGVGVAMAPLVRREGKPKTHIVIDAGAIAALLQDSQLDLRTNALQTVIHELSHCAEHTEMEANLPGFLLSANEGVFQKALCIAPGFLETVSLGY